MWSDDSLDADGAAALPQQKMWDEVSPSGPPADGLQRPSADLQSVQASASYPASHVVLQHSPVDLSEWSEFLDPGLHLHVPI